VKSRCMHQMTGAESEVPHLGSQRAVQGSPRRGPQAAPLQQIAAPQQQAPAGAVLAGWVAQAAQLAGAAAALLALRRLTGRP
jgi:hypothetical protein